MYSLSDDLEVRVSPCPPAGPFRVAVCNVHATHKTDFAVYDHDLPVVPVVYFAGEDWKCHFQESMDFDAGIRHFLEELVFHVPAAHIVVKNADFYSFFGFIDWYVVSKKLLNEKIYYPPLPVYSDDNIMQICTSGPVGQWRTLLQAAIFTVANAKKYVFIQTPYFLPTEGLNQALQIAALGGVDVRLMLPKRSDTRTANMATHSFIDEMVKAGVKVYFYKPGFLHSKLMVADDELTCIGSANMDFRSFEHNFEINAFVYQPSFAQQMRKVFLHDMHSCERLVPSRWLKRPLKQRIAESFMRLFSPLL